MPVLVTSEWLGSQQDYDALGEDIQQQPFAAEEDSDFHAMAATGPERFTVYEVWKTREACDAWMAKIMPIIQQHGVRPAGEMQYVDLHSVWFGQDQTFSDQEQDQHRLQNA